MQIQNYFSYRHPSSSVMSRNTRAQRFGGGGGLINRLTSVIPDTKACKNLTQLDINAFHAHIYSKKFQLGMTVEELKGLYKLEGEDFIAGAYGFLIKKLGIPDIIKPPMLLKEQNEATPFAYMFNYNAIFRNPDLSKLSKDQIFNSERHELQHFLQNMAMLRHEKLGDEVVKNHTKTLIQAEKQGTLQLLSSMSLDEISQIVQNPEDMARVKRCAKYIKNNDIKGFDNEFVELEKTFSLQVRDFKNKVVNSMGEIKAGTKEAEKAELYYESYENLNYFNPDGSIDYGKYLDSLIEQEALLAGDRANMEFLQEGCMARFVKRNVLEKFKNSDGEMNKVLDDIERY